MGGAKERRPRLRGRGQVKGSTKSGAYCRATAHTAGTAIDERHGLAEVPSAAPDSLGLWRPRGGMEMRSLCLLLG